MFMQIEINFTVIKFHCHSLQVRKLLYDPSWWELQLTMSLVFAVYNEPRFHHLRWALFSVYNEPCFHSLQWALFSQLTMSLVFTVYYETCFHSLQWTLFSQLTMSLVFTAYNEPCFHSLQWTLFSQLLITHKGILTMYHAGLHYMSEWF